MNIKNYLAFTEWVNKVVIINSECAPLYMIKAQIISEVCSCNVRRMLPV